MWIVGRGVGVVKTLSGLKTLSGIIPLSVSLKTLSGRTLTGINIPLNVKVVYNLSLCLFDKVII